MAATSTLINQAALVLDRSAESIALDAAGFPRRLFAATRRRHVLMPLAVTLTVSVGVGLVLATPFLTVFRFEPSGVLLVAATVVAGLLLTLGRALDTQTCPLGTETDTETVELETETQTETVEETNTETETEVVEEETETVTESE